MPQYQIKKVFHEAQGRTGTCIRMAHGTDNECNSVATMVGQIILFYF